MIRIGVVIWILVLALLGVGLFQVKYNVQAKEAELRHLKRQIDSNLSTIHVLEAEWSYLNDPVRLADLTRRHTDLLPTQANQIKNFADLPLRPSELPPALAPDAAPPPAQPDQAPTPPLVAATEPRPQQMPANASAPAPKAAVAAPAPAAIPAPAATPAIIPVSAQIGKQQDKPAAIKAVAKPAATPAAKQAAKQPAAPAQQPGSDEVIDAILADMQRAQDAPASSAAGDQ